YDAFHHMITSRGQEEGDEELLDDAVALAGVSGYPARVTCALMGWTAYKDAVGRQTAPSRGARDDGADPSRKRPRGRRPDVGCGEPHRGGYRLQRGVPSGPQPSRAVGGRPRVGRRSRGGHA